MGAMWMVWSKKVHGAGRAAAVSRHLRHSWLASRLRAMRSPRASSSKAWGARGASSSFTRRSWAATAPTISGWMASISPGEWTPITGTPSVRPYHWNQSFTSRHWFVL